MKVGIAGFSGSGKSTAFQWLTGVKPDPGKAQHGQVGIAKILDPRLDWLSQHFKPKKTTATTLEFLDTPGILVAERKDNARRLGIMRDSGSLLIVLNGFSGGDIVKEFQQFQEEILFADLDVVTGRIGRLEDQIKKPRPAKQKEADQEELGLLQKIVASLEAGKSAATLGLAEEDEKKIRSFQLLTLKPQMVLISTSEDLMTTNVSQKISSLGGTALQAPIRFDLELEELTEEERQAFIQDFVPEGTSQASSREEILRTIFSHSGQIVFFTVGEDECRAWSVAKNSTAVEAAGEIHTDLSRGFVRGEVIAYEDYKKAGSMKEAKSQGVYRLEGKAYIVQDGDIMHVLAST